VNFVTIDGSNSDNAEIVGRFRVDGIPHLAFVNGAYEVKTALVGAVPKPILTEEIDALIKNSPKGREGRAMSKGTSTSTSTSKGSMSTPPLPYSGYDAWASEGEEGRFKALEMEKNICALPTSPVG